MTSICPICIQKCEQDQQLIYCSSCLCNVHHDNSINCSGLTDSEFQFYTTDNNKLFKCNKCISYTSTFFPISHIADCDWLENINSKPIQNNLLGTINHLLPNIEQDFLVQCDSIESRINLQDNDSSEEEISLPLPVNSKYLDIEQINSIQIDTPSSFSFFHVNIASLDKHINDLKLILALINHKFDVIGISEHKIFKDTLPSQNIQIPGYNEFIFEPTETACGGTGFFIKDNLDFVRRNYLAINSPSDYESTFIEIKFPKKKNLIVGCMYRHPSSTLSVQEFSNFHLEPVLENISKENKKCVLMGDFNVNLLKIDINDSSNRFFNTLSSHFFTPFILQPTRLPSKSLIDNILFNSLEYQSSSGNLLIEISDHLIQFLILEGFVKERSLPKTNLFKRDLSNFNGREFSEALNDMNWDLICNIEMNDPNLTC